MTKPVPCPANTFLPFCSAIIATRSVLFSAVLASQAAAGETSVVVNRKAAAAQPEAARAKRCAQAVISIETPCIDRPQLLIRGAIEPVPIFVQQRPLLQAKVQIRPAIRPLCRMAETAHRIFAEFSAAVVTPSAARGGRARRR